MESVLQFLGIEGITLREVVVVIASCVFIFALGEYIQGKD